LNKILILGGAGMIGQKLAKRIASNQIDLPVSELLLHDIVQATTPHAPFRVTASVGNFALADEAKRLAAMRPDIVFHLAAVVSGEAEQQFDKGWDVNTKGSWCLLESLREQHEASGGNYTPRVIFTSSIAVFGAPFPEKIDDDFLCAPQTSYGAQKAATELLVADYARKGFIDGLSVRLPTICVRPGKPNLAASSFFSGIVREPLSGEEATLPVADNVRHWHASPRSAVGFLMRAANLDTALLEGRRSINLPGVSCTVAEQISALSKVAGNDVAKLIKYRPDKTIQKIVAGWPRDFDTQRARALGFTAEQNFAEIIEAYIEDDLPKQAF
jgi:nucleoside-diphosphate-sugar epimerase